MNTLPKNIIIAAEVHPDLIVAFQKKGHVVIYEPTITYNSLMRLINHAWGLVITTRLRIDKPLLDKATQLEWIGRLGSGMEMIDVDYATTKNIQCISTPEGNRQAVAEHVLGLILSYSKNILKSYLEIKEGLWLRTENRGVQLAGKTVGIVGYGNNGAAFAKLLQPFGVTVLAYDKYKQGFANDYIREASLEQIAKYADIISFHVPLTEETFHMINEPYLSSCERQPLLVNASRGKVMNTAAVIKALKNEWIGGACLDVLENEKIEVLIDEEQKQFNWLLNQSNVILTPHIAGYSFESYKEMGQVLLQKLGMN
jgi:D-3-phosphoglycerate dehydrogenase / 2-oxoglutarate reductase